MRISTDSFSMFLSLTSVIVILIISEAEATDRITTTQFLRENETIVSSGGSFELGFFRPGSSQNLYLGIWYKKITARTVVWVANREAPLTNQSVILKISSPGILNLYNETGFIIWSSNTSTRVEDPIAQLLDSGNLVVREANDDNPENFLWQSFDYPGNTFLPGMKLGKNLITDLDRYLSSWKSNDDPAPGDYTYRMDTRGYPQFVLRNGAIEKFRPGPWNGLTFSGSSLKPNMIFNYSFVFSKEEVYYTYELTNSSVISRRVLNQSVGVMQRWTWADHRGWILYSEIPMDNCDIYASCGEYGSCNIGNTPQCGCLDKFVPRHQNNWDSGDWSSGCIRRVPLACRGGEGFMKYSGLKLPDTRNSWFNTSMTLEECRKMCLGNCSCMAYARLDIRKGASGCLMWLGSLVDIRETEDGQDIYVKMASSELGSQGKRREAIIVSLTLVIGVSLLCLSLTLYFWKKKHRQLERTGIMSHGSSHTETSKSHKEDLQLPSFDLTTIVDATDNFSLHNKLGEGGFGPVYKGVLEGGQEIAVKRLSSSSRQGPDEFKNEVIYIAKLQHRNLVKLLGCCIQGEEKMLIYEYLSNKSLNLFIFDETLSKLLDWPKRFHIINGIARGLVYLHQDSRLRIIHRDLKASNILLDIDMTPKISDFGMARSFGANETEANTNRVVGTYGYMSPEYAVDGIFSVKSDVFSFGVLVLEIVSGKRNRGFSHSNHLHNLLGHAWKLYQEGRALEVVDAAIVNSIYVSEMLRSIQVALLCVQQSPEDRPSMSSVVLMLGNDGALPQPKQPGFFTERKVVESEYSTSRDTPSSVNEITITLLEAR
ncbi:G-type lectin S-receptor-like serine/threonine-protein kinase At4g27290 isoform X4 [Diospyros lotus]|uniref:G-type lectin S-receptor-like serine/threonine-protein kinase At4g27290 isoform X4 n=1 Tax=Diospyros lotus TaxID=55363 RepID=UPI002251A78F|nr:G-type lectin S-receptor-like serine/threonine-protein kinase At4g27290 isoform X4 [Diospyros lotus]